MASKRKPNPAAEVPVNAAVFDRAHLARYTMDSVELEREIIDLFLVQLPETLAMIRTAATAADWKLATHSLKGSAAAVGAHGIHCLAVDLEGLTVDCVSQRDQLIVKLDGAADEFRALVKAIYS